MCQIADRSQQCPIPHFNAMNWYGCLRGHTNPPHKRISRGGGHYSILTRSVFSVYFDNWSRLSWTGIRFVSEKFDPNTIFVYQRDVINKLILSHQTFKYRSLHWMFSIERTFRPVFEERIVRGWSYGGSATMYQSLIILYLTLPETCSLFEGDCLPQKRVAGNSCRSLTGCGEPFASSGLSVVTSKISFCRSPLIFAFLRLQEFSAPRMNDGYT